MILNTFIGRNGTQKVLLWPRENTSHAAMPERKMAWDFK